MYKFIASTSGVIRTLQAMHPEQPELADTMRHCLSLTPNRKGEVLAFANGAKLRRLGSHLWGVDGYSETDAEYAANAFARAMRAAKLADRTNPTV